MRRLWWVILVVLVAGAAFLLVRPRLTGEQAPEDQQLQTVVVERGDLVVSVRVTGEVLAGRSAQLGFDTAGIVAEVLVEEGQFVRAGDILARLDNEPQRIALEQAELARQIADLNLASLERGPDQRELNIARANVNSAWAAYVDLRDNSVTQEQIRAAELRYEQALAAWDAAEQASRDARRTEVSLAQVGQASFNAEIARLQLEQLRQGPSQAVLNASQAQVAQAQARLRQVEAGPTQAELDRAAISLRQAELGVQRAQEALEATFLKAPFDGIVHRVNVQAGGIVAPGGLPAFEIVDVADKYVRVQVDEIDVVQVTPGQRVELTFDALERRRFEGTVERVADVATQSGGVTAFDVDIRLAEDAPEILIGMTAAATIIVQELQSVIMVPNVFVRLGQEPGTAFVDVVDESGNLVEREIVLGAQNDSMSEVIEGLQVGEQVAIDLSAGGFSFFGGS
ncbi:MAG: hypothetical protein Kow0077_03760 [Anaerolineae bacterium]